MQAQGFNIAELPTMAASAHSHSTVNLTALTLNGGGNTMVGAGAWSGGGSAGINAFHPQQYIGGMAPTITIQDPTTMNGKGKLRVVRVFLLDPDERVPLETRMLHVGKEQITDSTDQELFFELDVTNLLKKHNAEVRASTKWEEKTPDGNRDRVGLKEARIRDLVMTVTTIAEFASR